MFLEKSVSGIILTSRKTAEQQKKRSKTWVQCFPPFNVSSNSKSVMDAYRLLYCTNDESDTQWKTATHGKFVKKNLLIIIVIHIAWKTLFDS